MSRAHRFLRLSPPDRRLVLRAALLLGLIGVALRLLSFQTVCTVVVRLAGAPHLVLDDPRMSSERIAWAVRHTAASIPGATCLVQALAARVLLGQRGLPARVRIGVGRAEDAALRGHAWVESGGVIVVGGGEGSRYTVLPFPRMTDRE
jgi:hypothetical protein